MMFFCVFLIGFSSFSQNTQDLREYIKANITYYPSAKNIRNYAIFKDDILQEHLRHFTGKTVTDDEFQFIFMFGIEIHKGNSLLNDIEFEFAEIIDLRAIHKIETIHNITSNNSKLLLYLREGFLAKIFLKEGEKEEIRELTGPMEITLEKNDPVALKLKMAFIELGKRLNINILDGDLF